jgi:UPF0755 protein
VKFTVGGGETVGQIGRALAAQGLVLDALAFSYLAVTQGVDDKLHTGTFNLDASMTPQEIVDRLQLPPDPVTTRVLLNLRAGLRLEQIAAKLQTEKALELDPEAFYKLLTDPPDWVRTEFPWLKALPKGRSLEGFIGLGPIPVDANITPEDLLRVLLTLASIAQRETADPDELDRVAGVYVNRLNPSLWPTGILNADPTVSYAVDTDKLAKMDFNEWQKYSFFGVVRNQARKKVSAAMQSYQTYVNPGLPDGPIGSPTLTSIRAAANPDTKGNYLFFYACPGSKTHRFARDQAGQQRNIDRCN